MTLREIKAMFQSGQQWKANNTYMPQANGIRTVGHVYSAKMTWQYRKPRAIDAVVTLERVSA